MQNDDEYRRMEALQLAVKLTAEQQVGKYDSAVTLNVAREFESYLRGKGTAL